MKMSRPELLPLFVPVAPIHPQGLYPLLAFPLIEPACRKQHPDRLDAIGNGDIRAKRRCDAQVLQYLPAASPRPQFPDLNIVRKIMVAVEIIPGLQFPRIPIQTNPLTLEHVDNTCLAPGLLDEPDHRLIRDAQIPCRVNKKPWVVWHRCYPRWIAGLGFRKLLCVVSPPDSGIERALIFLRVLIVAHHLARVGQFLRFKQPCFRCP